MQLMLQGHAHCSCQLDNEAARFTTTPFTGQPFLTDLDTIEHEEPVPRQFPMEEKHSISRLLVSAKAYQSANGVFLSRQTSTSRTYQLRN